MVRYLFYTIGDLTYQSPLVFTFVHMCISTVHARPLSVQTMLIAYTACDCSSVTNGAELYVYRVFRDLWALLQEVIS